MMARSSASSLQLLRIVMECIISKSLESTCSYVPIYLWQISGLDHPLGGAPVLAENLFEHRPLQRECCQWRTEDKRLRSLVNASIQ